MQESYRKPQIEFVAKSLILRLHHVLTNNRRPVFEPNGSSGLTSSARQNKQNQVPMMAETKAPNPAPASPPSS